MSARKLPRKVLVTSPAGRALQGREALARINPDAMAPQLVTMGKFQFESYFLFVKAESPAYYLYYNQLLIMV